MRNDGIVAVQFKATPKQTIALQSLCREILYGGARGGGKSYGGRLWLLRHIDKPYFRGLVVRLNATDLREWLDHAAEMYKPLGAVFSGKPVTIRWPSGAIIYTTHLGDDAAWQAVQGWGIQNVVLEEAGQIPSEERYSMLLGSLRTTFTDIPAQVFLTANPGGPGHGWLKKRFVDAYDSDGNPTHPFTPFYTDSGKRLSRIFIPATIDDNPYIYEADPGYVDYLESLSPTLKKAWRYGDWNAFEGAFFPEFRRYRVEGEPPEACHVIPAFDLPGYLHKWLATDWGFYHPCPTYFFARDEEGRIHVYREMISQGLGPEELGVRLAEVIATELDGSTKTGEAKTMTMALSPDAFARRDNRLNTAEQIAEGAALVLGRDAVFLADLNQDELLADPADALASMERRRVERADRIKLTINRANNDRTGGWNYLRQLMRWWPIKAYNTRQPDIDTIRKILDMPDSTQRYQEYISQFNPVGEVLPRILIHDCVTVLPGKILAAQHNPKNPEDTPKRDGDDEIEALRYGVMEHRKIDLTLPRDIYIARGVGRIEMNYGSVSTHSKVLMARAMEAKYNQLNMPTGFTPRRR